MNKTVTALLVKFVATLGATWIAFSLLENNTFGFVLTVAIAGTLLNYLIGDLLILPNFGNLVASLGDGGLAMLTAYIIGTFTYGFRANITTFIIFGILVAIFEYFFHIYLLKTEEVAPNTSDTHNNHTNFNMEAGDEFSIDSNKDDRDNNEN
ncbi:hypothetical protein CLPU_7c01180 [Gottschalkia purinilytica]|uniref:DUF2512 family protein n=1 Tax=Gottschalkia purinilytica TaxID=1503 RepID=A0A0L0WB05_GOTPU|nr:DUF2512 family protein [Gottschalkia purinilytica]KNF08490.1 hypothetical protein CLPU_7c01180 [Gottschalkia purinilytica]